ncbi:hypothetical protein [Aquella oligotrophica]|uniref:Uncharacterized protein n=1 Tax=Aquella oligotrophica TaxID=2067065 RepID=A0A2I7N641_9NEIS|nr:hypothetical protein [Aquella oligotrophica]AUR51900.1 hypothetical protein CUN60_06175 [Aquella oligotrophica]
MNNERKILRRGTQDIELGYLEGYLQSDRYQKIANELLSILPVYQTINGVTTRLRSKKGTNGRKKVIASRVTIIG